MLRMRSIMLIGIFLFVVSVSCQQPENSEDAIGVNDVVSEKIIEELAGTKIFFGHQSVGGNILDGMKLLSDEIRIAEVENTATGLPEEAQVVHSLVGENNDPVSKVDDFYSKMVSGLGEEIDFAFLKLCYVDFDKNTDVDTVFNEYSSKFEELSALYPDVQFIHFTTPLTTQQTGIKASIKRMIGKDVWGEQENIRRQEYNELIRKNYPVVFDLAQIEATEPDGNILKHSLNGKEYYSLSPEYTYDGGHLNETGARRVASRLMILLSELKK